MSSWNVEPEEKLIAFPSDKYSLDEDAVLYRGISILAPASVVYRWLCQLRVAPYSYDRLDNLGRQSPQSLTLGDDELEVGQRMMGFEPVDFQPDQSITLRGKQTIYGDGVGSYLILLLTEFGPSARQDQNKVSSRTQGLTPAIVPAIGRHDHDETAATQPQEAI